MFGFIDTSQYFLAFTTWWVGDGVGVLLVTPLILTILSQYKAWSRSFYILLVFCVLVFAVSMGMIFDVIYPYVWLIILCALLVPIAFVAMLYAGQRLVFIVQFLVSAIAIYSTHFENGPFIVFYVISPLMSLQLFVGVFSCILLALAVVVNQRQVMTERLEAQQQKLESLYRHDALTGLWNRYRIEEFLDLETKRLKREGSGFATFMIDLDNFKSINDKYGHVVGDDILKSLSHLISAHIRDGDLFGRWGGEEFIIIAVDTTATDAESLAAKLIALVAHHDFGLKQPVTISIGFSLSH